MIKAWILGALCITLVSAGGIIPIKNASGYFLVEGTNNQNRDTTIELWNVNLRITKSYKTTRRLEIIKTRLKRNKDATFAMLGSTYTECHDQMQTCKFEEKGDSIKVESFQQRVTKYHFKITGESSWEAFYALGYNHELSPDDSLRVKCIGKRIVNELQLMVRP